MPDTTLIAVLLAGFLGGGHCAGMCGGIVSALSAGAATRLALLLAYNLGRIASYGLAGALAGSAGTWLLRGDLISVQTVLYVVANLILLLVGLYLAGISNMVSGLEVAGRGLWRIVGPTANKFLPIVTAPGAFAVGAIWGWLPCGLVYSTLAIALVSGSAERGAQIMLVFGLGTLPNLLAAGALIRTFARVFRRRVVRMGGGALVFGFGVAGLERATGIGGHIRRGILCMV